MTEYKEEVIQRAMEIEAEAWGSIVKSIEARQGRIDTSYNSGKIVREYHRDFEEHKKGDVIVLEEASQLSDMVNEMTRPQDGFSSHYK